MLLALLISFKWVRWNCEEFHFVFIYRPSLEGCPICKRLTPLSSWTLSPKPHSNTISGVARIPWVGIRAILVKLPASVWVSSDQLQFKIKTKLGGCLFALGLAHPHQASTAVWSIREWDFRGKIHENGKRWVKLSFFLPCLGRKERKVVFCRISDVTRRCLEQLFRTTYICSIRARAGFR